MLRVGACDTAEEVAERVGFAVEKNPQGLEPLRRSGGYDTTKVVPDTRRSGNREMFVAPFREEKVKGWGTGQETPLPG